MNTTRCLTHWLGIALLFWALHSRVVFGEISPDDAALFVRFDAQTAGLRFLNGAHIIDAKPGKCLELTASIQFAELNYPAPTGRVEAVSVGGWFFPRRRGEQSFFCRGLPEIAPQGERMFPPKPDWVNFILGTDERGFLLGTINGNGNMPFPHVTVSEVPFDAWSQLVVVKDAQGFHKFYQNGTLVHTDSQASSGGVPRPLLDTAAGEPVRLAMPLGGLIGEAWMFRRELTAEEIRKDYLGKRNRYNPALPVVPALLREINPHPQTDLWRDRLPAVTSGTATPLLTSDGWAEIRPRISEAAMEVLGAFPTNRVPLAPEILSEVDCGSYTRRKITLQVQPGDRMPAYLLVPKSPSGGMPAVICFYGTSAGAGKDTTVGLSGLRPGSPPQRNFAFAVDMVEAGFVALAPDYLRDGERVAPGKRPYDTTDFYERFPDWSIHGKDIWDTSRAIDYLQTLPFVDPEKIGMIGHSYGGHSTIFATALEPRIKVAVANGPVSDFLHHGLHWAVPKGGANSQSLPAMRPYVLDRTLKAPLTFYEFTALIAPRPLLVGQAAGERRPMEEENYAAVSQVYRGLGAAERVRYHWYAGDHDFPPEAREAAVNWFRRWFAVGNAAAAKEK